MYSFMEHRQAAITKKEEFTVDVMNEIKDMFLFFDLELDKVSSYHVQLLRHLENREVFLMKKTLGHIVKHGYHWSKQIQISNVRTLMSLRLNEENL